MSENSSSSTLDKFLSGSLLTSGVITLIFGAILIALTFVEKPDEYISIYVTSLSIVSIGAVSLYHSVTFFRSKIVDTNFTISCIVQSLLLLSPSIFTLVSSEISFGEGNFVGNLLLVVFTFIGIVTLFITPVSYFSKSKNPQKKSTSTIYSRGFLSPLILSFSAIFLVTSVSYVASNNSSGKQNYNTECLNQSGTHTGLYQGAGESGRLRVEIEDDCDYEVYLNGQKYGDGTFEKDGSNLTFENGTTAQYSGSTISWIENTSSGTVVYEAN